MSCRIVRGDCFRVMPRMPAGSIDLVVTDPPYGTTDLAWDKSIDLDRMWAEIMRLLKPAGVVVCFAAQSFATDVINANRKHFAYDLVWEKARPVGFLDANHKPLRAHELMLVFSRKKRSHTYNPQKTPGKPYTIVRDKPCAHYHGHTRNVSVNTGDRHPRSVLRFTHDARSEHPTQKPLALARWLVRSYSNRGDLVFDPFVGSGTTAVACAIEGRACVGIEREPSYLAVARRRVKEAIERPPVGGPHHPGQGWSQSEGPTPCQPPSPSARPPSKARPRSTRRSASRSNSTP